MSELELAGLTGPVRGSLAGHGLDVTVPFEVERVETEIDGATTFLAGLVVGRVAAYRLDLPIAVSGVLLRVELVGRRRAAGETVVSGELLEHTRGGTVEIGRASCRERRMNTTVYIILMK